MDTAVVALESTPEGCSRGAESFLKSLDQGVWKNVVAITSPFGMS